MFWPQELRPGLHRANSGFLSKVCSYTAFLRSRLNQKQYFTPTFVSLCSLPSKKNIFSFNLIPVKLALCLTVVLKTRFCWVRRILIHTLMSSLQGRKRHRHSPEGRWQEDTRGKCHMPLPTPEIWVSGSQNCEEINFNCFRAKVCSVCYVRPRKWMHLPREWEQKMTLPCGTQRSIMKRAAWSVPNSLVELHWVEVMGSGQKDSQADVVNEEEARVGRTGHGWEFRAVLVCMPRSMCDIEEGKTRRGAEGVRSSDRTCY